MLLLGRNEQRNIWYQDIVWNMKLKGFSTNLKQWRFPVLNPCWIHWIRWRIIFDMYIFNLYHIHLQFFVQIINKYPTCNMATNINTCIITHVTPETIYWWFISETHVQIITHSHTKYASKLIKNWSRYWW